MKKLLLLALASALVLGSVAMASAEVQVYASGDYEMSFNYWNHKDFRSADDDNTLNDEEHVGIRQRARMDFRFTANENVSMFTRFTTGSDDFGDEKTVGDNFAVELDRAYVEWNWPGTELLTQVGFYPLGLPDAGYFGNPGLDADVAGALLSYRFNDMVAATGGWFRPGSNGANGGRVADNNNNTSDVFYLALPLTFEGVSLSPYGAIATVGNDSGLNGLWNSYNSTAEDDVQNSAWWAGIGIKVDVVEDFNFYGDFHYSASEYGESQNDRNGYIADLAVEYTGLDFMVPSLFGFYASGLDDDADNGDERYFGVQWVNDENGFNVPGSFTLGDPMGRSADSTMSWLSKWAVGLNLDQIQFIPDLTHQFVVFYAQGTSDEDAVKGRNAANINNLGSGQYLGAVMTDEDSMWELDFNNTYQVYESLAMFANFGIASLDVDEDTWQAAAPTYADDTETAWRFTTGFKYKF